MRKTLLASLGLTLMLSTTASVALAEEANPVPNKQLNTASTLTGNEQEPNDSFEEANYQLIGDSVIGTLGESINGTWEGYDVFKFKSFEAGTVEFVIEGDKYSDGWLELTLYDSTGKRIKRSRDGQYFLTKALDGDQEYYLAVDSPGLQLGGHVFWYKLSSRIVD
ncbi:hypothetical protein ASL14_02720 [Paenibacillus sp. IHB B 3084]|uniref:hypothetical protein n=1 Tax=Paenibacillus TaxID=44249 RepID=UPI00071FE9A8|nr:MULTISPECIES: hypothetical protein [Paenibacillus]ALP35253.1 hypothetical protein ASL14_02720 [Paenibacillus sp. IHB B 3084]